MCALSSPEAFSDTLCKEETEEARFEMPAFDALVDYYGCIDFVTQREKITWVPNLANGWAGEVLGEYVTLEELWLRKNYAEWGEEEKGEDVTLKLVPRCKHADDRLFTDELLGEVETFLWESFE